MRTQSWEYRVESGEWQGKGDIGKLESSQGSRPVAHVIQFEEDSEGQDGDHVEGDEDIDDGRCGVLIHWDEDLAEFETIGGLFPLGYFLLLGFFCQIKNPFYQVKRVVLIIFQLLNDLIVIIQIFLLVVVIVFQIDRLSVSCEVHVDAALYDIKAAEIADWTQIELSEWMSVHEVKLYRWFRIQLSFLLSQLLLKVVVMIS